MEHSIFTQLSLVIVIVAVVSMVMHLLKQPLIVSYILTGILVGPAALDLIKDREAFLTFSEIGIAMLLFIIGMGLNAAIVKNLGKVVLLASLVEVVGVGILGYLISVALGFGAVESVIIGLALIFSSTIIIIKVLNDKKEQTRLYGQIAVGVLLVEDVIATIALLFVSTAGAGGLEPLQFVELLFRGMFLGAGLILASVLLLPWITRYFAGRQELLFFFAVGWGLGIASLFELAGFSVEVGALFAGVSLASLPYAREISSRLKPLRDFFVVIFFIVLGGSLQLSNIAAGLVPALIFSAVVILAKPVLTMTSLGVLGYTKRTSFKTGINLSQISEFSIVLVVLAVSTGIVRPELTDIITLVALITIAVSTYLMKYDDALYEKLEPHLQLFERKVVSEHKKPDVSYPLILFGYKKGGHEFVRTFKEMKKHYVVIDYNPEVVETLEHQHINYVYGDATDLELLEEVGVDQAKLLVSTITDFNTNKMLVLHVNRINPRAVIICHGDNYDEAAELYELGATYVMLPHLIGSERISAFVRRHGTSKGAFEDYRQKHLISLGRTAVHN